MSSLRTPNGVNEAPVRIDRFYGLRNTIRPERQPLGALSAAQNVIIDNTGVIERRFGYAQALALTSVTDAYQHKNLNYALVVDGGSLISVDAGLGRRVLAAGLTDATFKWAQVENRVFYAGANDAGMVINGITHYPLRFPDTPVPTVVNLNGTMPAGIYKFAQVYRHVASGMEGPMSPPMISTTTADCAFHLTPIIPAGYEADLYVSSVDDATLRYLVTIISGSAVYDADTDTLGPPIEEAQINGYPLPDDVCGICVHETCLYAATWNQNSNTSMVFASRPHYYHIFTLDEDAFSVAGKIEQMESTDQGLLIGTTQGVWLKDAGDNLQRLADYGVVPGRPMCKDQRGNVIIWTVRGLRAVSPWSDPYENKCSVAPGATCSTYTLEYKGQRFAIALTDTSGTAFNAY